MPSAGDGVGVKERPIAEQPTQVRSAATVVALSGGSFFISDNLAELPRYTPVPADAALVTTMQDAWLAFARGEDPAGWPAFDPAAPSYRIFTEPATTASEVREGRCAELEALGLVR